MKIYNEIITIFNDETQKWETLYEDSFEYGGPLLLAAYGACDSDDSLMCGQPTSGHNACAVDANNMGNECCQIDALMEIRDADGTRLRLTPASDNNCGGSDDYSLAFLSHEDDSYQQFYPGQFLSHGMSICCIPNNVKTVKFLDSGIDASGETTVDADTGLSWSGAIPFCNSLVPGSFLLQDFYTCKTSQGNDWNIDIDLGDSHFTKSAKALLEYYSYSAPTDVSTTRQEDWLCGLGANGAAIQGCTGWEGALGILCGCPNDDCNNLTEVDASGGDCVPGVPCKKDGSANFYYCSSGLDCFEQGGFPGDTDCMIYPDVDGAVHCDITNNCGVCSNPNDIAQGEGNQPETTCCCSFWDTAECDALVPGETGHDCECCNCTTGIYDDCEVCGETSQGPLDELDGLYSGGGFASGWCSCDNQIPPTTVTCIDRYSSIETGEDILVCQNADGTADTFASYPSSCDDYPVGCTQWNEECTASNDQTCCHYVATDYEAMSELYDTGCVDDNACNYSEEWELACDGCCIYPLVYCIANGSLYNADNLGADNLCDVDENNIPSTVVYCPICDCESQNCDGGPCDCPVGSCANQTGYSLINPVDPGSSAEMMSNSQTQYHWYLIGGTVDEGLQGNGPPDFSASGYLAGSGGVYDGTIIFAALMDCTGDVCEELTVADSMLDTWLETWILTGCTDTAALNFDLYQQALWVGTDVADPSTICDYCPGPGEQDDCPNGYEFHWAEEYHLSNVTTQANVSVGDAWAYGGGINFPENFQLEHQGEGGYDGYLISPFAEDGGTTTYGACFCIDDLTFLDDLLNTLPTNQSDAVNSSLQINGISGDYGGVQEWNSDGRLSKFTTGGEDMSCALGDENNCREMGLQLGNTDQGAASGILPASIGNLEWLQYLDLSFGYLQGAVPAELGNLKNLISLNLSYNWFDSIPIDEHFTDLNLASYGLCILVELLDEPTYGVGGQPNNYWLKLMGNKICPDVESQYLMTTTYPNCLSPQVGDSVWTNPNIFTEEWQRWVYHNLGFIELPNTDLFPGFNHDAQNIITTCLTETGDEYECLSCDNFTGCKIEHATNYWPEANNACDGCCTFDRFLHFPWGENPDGNVPAGFGGGMSLYQMVQALHANIFGFQYNNFGHLDVTGYPTSAIESPGHIGACDYDEIYGALPMETVYNCQFGFSNDPSIGGVWTDYVDGNGVISHWDGIWLRDSGNKGDGTCMTFTGAYIENDDGMQSCDGDSRPLDYIQRVEYEDAISPGQGIKNYWFNQFFPAYGADISFQGIEWYQDYDINNDGEINNSDATEWETKLGRYDISEMIGNMPPFPDYEPDDVELWEQTPIYVSMSYSQKFISEAAAGFTLWPENNSPGVLQRSGQWVCADGGDASVCYEDMMACSDGLPDWVENCTPCGMETSPDSQRKCVPLTSVVAAEGHEKISKTKIISVPYFSNGNSNILIGSNVYTASLSSSNHPYYFSVMDGNPNLSQYDSQFDVSWGHYAGSGSYTADDTIKGTSEAAYKQYASMLLGDKIIDNGFLISSGSDVISSPIDGNKDEWIYVLNFKRKRFEDQLQSTSWTLILSGSDTAGNGSTIHLTDDGAASTVPPHVGHVGYRYNIISGSAGTPYSGYSVLGDRYGFFYPEIGIMVLGEKIANVLSGVNKNPSIGAFNSTSIGNNSISPLTGSNVDAKNALRFINCMRNVSVSPDTSGSTLTLYGEKTVTDVIYICILNNNNFNFTNNFSILSGSGRRMYISGIGLNPDVGVMGGFNTAYTSSAFTSSDQPSAPVYDGGAGSFYETNQTTTNELIDGGGDPFIWPGSNIPTMHGNPTTFITGIELFDEHGECVVTARLSKPLKKDFEKEVVIKVKLSY